MISRICQYLTEKGLSVALAAPTGKAAKRIQESSGLPASTIHRLYGYNGHEWGVDRYSPLFHDVLIVDEVSMMDVRLMWRMFDGIDLKETSVILVGDHNQLPPIGAGNILRDLVNTEVVPYVVLDQIVRHAGLLSAKCSEILSGEIDFGSKTEPDGSMVWHVNADLNTHQEVHDYIEELHKSRFSKRGFDPVADVQLLAPQRKGPLGTIELNRLVQRVVQKHLWEVDIPPPGKGVPRFHVNDKVIQTKNNYNLGNGGVMNGTIGTVHEITDRKSLIIDFGGNLVEIERGSGHMEHLDLAYVLTVHKSQGSEFPCVVFVAHSDHEYMLHRNLYYTAVTRAKKAALTIGDRQGIEHCVKHTETEKRRTYMSQLL